MFMMKPGNWLPSGWRQNCGKNTSIRRPKSKKKFAEIDFFFVDLFYYFWYDIHILVYSKEGKSIQGKAQLTSGVDLDARNGQEWTHFTWQLWWVDGAYNF